MEDAILSSRFSSRPRPLLLLSDEKCLQVQIGDETLLKFSGVPLGEACSVVLRGATEQIIGEAERSLHDALCVLTSTVKEPRTVFGGGCSEMLMAKAVDEMAAKTAGKEARAMESFANALRQLPGIIAENGGYDSAQLTSELKAAHNSGKNTVGLNMVSGQNLSAVWTTFFI